MFKFINNVKTAMFLAAMMALFLVVGSFFGRGGIIIALGIGLATNFIAYFYSDRIALATMGAREVSPSDAPRLHRIVRDLAMRAEIPMPKVYIAPVAAPNAFATGRNPSHAAVCVTEGIMNMLNENEIRGVLAHEIAHIKHYDILISTVAAALAGAISALGYLFWFIPLGDSRGGNPLAALAMIILAPIAAALIQAAISRKREFNADNYGAELVGDGTPLAVALEKLHAGNQRHPMQLLNRAQANMFIVEPFSGSNMVNLFATHPPVRQRIEKLIARKSTGLIY